MKKGNILSSPKGYTLIELLISISILAVIMAAVASIFVTSIKSYRTESQKSAFQREVNFAIDSIDKDIKSAAVAPENYDNNSFFLSSNTLILALPATDQSNNFIYTGDALEKDVVIYYLSGQNLKRKIYANPLGTRHSGEDTILNNVTALTFYYDPGLTNASQIKTDITVSTNVGRNVSVSAERIANMRNKQ